MTATENEKTGGKLNGLARLFIPVLGLVMLGMAFNTGALMLFGETSEAVVSSVNVSWRQRSGNKSGQRRVHTAYYTFSLPDGEKISGSSSDGAASLKKGDKVTIHYLPFYPRINNIASAPFNIMSFLLYSLLGVSVLVSALFMEIRRRRQCDDS